MTAPEIINYLFAFIASVIIGIAIALGIMFFALRDE